MTYLAWAFRLALATVVVAVLHYTLPQRDIVYVTGVDIKREDLGSNTLFWAQGDAGSAGGVVSRDVRFIDTVLYGGGDVMVYRNEDTGWAWPPYLKFDSADLQAEARNLVSTQAEPGWAVIRHYGWRNIWLSIYPNALSIRPIDDPETRLIPWFNIAVLTVLFALFWAIRVRWIQFRQRRIDPISADIWDGFEDVLGRITRFFRRRS